MDGSSVTYAGFWKRFAAFLIDAIILSIVEFIIILPGLAAFGIGVAGSFLSDEPADGAMLLVAAIGAYFLAILLSFIAGWLYYALFESSARGATPGKMALGIRVTDLSGTRISFGRATGRYFGKMLSSLILMIGYLMAAFTDRKQALHDILAGCLVVNA